MNSKEKYLGGISQERILHKKSIFPELLCGLCHQVLSRPQVCCECESPFCEPCLDEWKRLYYNDTKTCPNNCVGEYTQPSKLLKNLLNKLQVKCRQAKNGCDRDLAYEDLDQHESECDYQEAICAGCIKKGIRKDIKGHQAECDMILTTCTKCSKELTKTELLISHDVSYCFSYKFEKLEGTFHKRIAVLEEENKNLQKKMEKDFEENMNYQRKTENGLLEKIRMLEEQNKTLEMKVEELIQDKKRRLEDEKNAGQEKEGKYLRVKTENVLEISSDPQVIDLRSDRLHQKLTVDSDPHTRDKTKVWHLEGHGPSWKTIKWYDNFDALIKGQFKEKTLEIKGCGTYWTIFKDHLFFIMEDGEIPVIGKLNVNSCGLDKSDALNDAVGLNKTHCWGGYNDILFISNTKNLYIVYESKETNKMVIGLMNPVTLKVTKTWVTNSQPKKTYGSIFMINDVLFATQSFQASPTKIIYKFDTRTGQEEDIDISFANIGGYDVSLHYCYQTKQLWTVNNGKLYLYDVKILGNI